MPTVVYVTTAAVLFLGVVSCAWVLLRDPVTLATPLVILGLAAVFYVTESVSLHVDHRDQSVGISSAEYALAICFFVVSPATLVVARALGGVAHRALRGRGVKRLFNIGMLLMSTGVAALVVRDAPLDIQEPRAWGLAGLALLLSAVADASALAVVIRATTQARAPIGARMFGTLVGQTIVAGMVSIGLLLLWDIMPVASLFMVAPAVVAAMTTRMAFRENKEAERLRTLYELAKGLSRAPELESVLAEAVREARALLRGETVELLLLDGGPAGEDLVLQAGERGGLRRFERPTAALLDGEARVEADEIVVAISGGGDTYGHLAVLGRPYGRTAFGESDLTALRALADNIGASVDRSRLTQELRTTAETTRFLEAHDVLTGLGNRRWFVDELQRMAGEHSAVAVALLNLRGFRGVNEQLGQAMGDVLLVEVADRLRADLPQEAIIARLAGDEFAVAVPDNDLSVLADVVGRPATSQLRGEHVELPVAAGIAAWPMDIDRPEGLLRAADLALVTARQQSSGGVVRFDAELEASFARRSRLANDLRGALDRGDVGVHFQPLVDVGTRDVVAVEALARWTHPELGPVPPIEFVTVAEGSGQVGALTRHVLAVATRQAAEWERDGTPVEVAVNISALDLEGPDLVQDVRGALDGSGLAPARLVLEVTETAMMVDRARGAATLAELSVLGVGLAIDDFGTGHSSLAYLQDLPVTEIKVDRVFVADILDNEQSELIVRTVVELAARRDLVVVAEGVEDEAVMQRLAALGVDRVQGWHTGRPAPAADLVLSSERVGNSVA